MNTPPRRTTVTVKDVVLWALLSLPVLAGTFAGGPTGNSLWAQAVGLVVLGGAVAAGRRYPLAALLLGGALIAPVAVGELHGFFSFGLPVLSYLAGRRMDRVRPALWAFAATFAVGSPIVLIGGFDVMAWFALALWLVLLGVLPWLVGRYWRQYQELVHAGWERAERLEREQHILAEQTRLRERARIAQDMHDSLGHELSLIALRAGALQVAPDLADHHRKAARELRASAADAIDRLREIIGVLRVDGEPAPTEPVGESVTDLAHRAAASGMRIEVRRTGAAGQLAPMVDRAVYRVVQESLTNAAKHAPGAAVTVELAHHDTETVVTVTNQPPPAPAPSPEPPPGNGRRDDPGDPQANGQGRYGLTGLRERVRLAGGTLRAGATDAGGFEVRARLPHTAAAAAPDDHPAAGPGRTESADQLARAQQRVRRGLIAAVATTAGLIACLGAVMAGYYVYMTANSVLAPDQYQRLRIGQDRAQVEAVLPKEELLGGAARGDPPIPAGATCRYYRPDANLLALGTVYRLCFAGDRLVAKDAISTTTRTENTR
ncbi:MAG TPA: histidine kinase [Streptosporangiaceae bacterium]|nr:histidine kinase [Streptosporangiaceae bacterium]